MSWPLFGCNPLSDLCLSLSHLYFYPWTVDRIKEAQPVVVAGIPKEKGTKKRKERGSEHLLLKPTLGTEKGGRKGKRWFLLTTAALPFCFFLLVLLIGKILTTCQGNDPYYIFFTLVRAQKPGSECKKTKK